MCTSTSNIYTSAYMVQNKCILVNIVHFITPILYNNFYNYINK